MHQRVQANDTTKDQKFGNGLEDYRVFAFTQSESYSQKSFKNLHMYCIDAIITTGRYIRGGEVTKEPMKRLCKKQKCRVIFAKLSSDFLIELLH